MSVQALSKHKLRLTKLTTQHNRRSSLKSTKFSLLQELINKIGKYFGRGPLRERADNALLDPYLLTKTLFSNQKTELNKCAW